MSLLPDRGWERAQGRSTSLAPATFWAGTPDQLQSKRRRSAAETLQSGVEKPMGACGHCGRAMQGTPSEAKLACGGSFAVGGWRSAVGAS